MNKLFVKEYGDFLKKQARFKKPIKVVFDCSNGYAGEVLKEVLKGVPNIVPIYMNARPDGDFPGHGPNPTIPGALDALSLAVVAKKADLGVAFDGDADRAIFVDDLGREIDSDDLIGLYVAYKKPKAIVIDLRIGWSIREMPGIKKVRTKVGNYYIKKGMIENDISFGAERAGHYYFKIKGAYIDGAIMMSLIVASIVSKAGSISGKIDGQKGKYHRIKETNFPVRDKEATMASIRKAYIRRRPVVSDLDGLTMEFKDFWFNIRPSANEDLLRLNIEARTEQVLQKELGVIESLIKKA